MRSQNKEGGRTIAQSPPSCATPSIVRFSNGVGWGPDFALNCIRWARRPVTGYSLPTLTHPDIYIYILYWKTFYRFFSSHPFEFSHILL